MMLLRLSVYAIAGMLAAVGSATRASDPRWENLPNSVLGQVADFEGAGGVRVAGYVRRPAGPGPFPLVIVLHGGGPTAREIRGDDEQARLKMTTDEVLRASRVLGRAFNPPIPDFLAQGWAVYTIDYRPNPRYTLDPLELEDTLIAVNKARSFDFVDPKRMAMFGGSHGGHVTGRMTSRVDLACAVLCAPAGLDLIALSHQAEQGAPIGGNQRLIRELEQRSGVKMAEIEKHPEAYQYSSPFTEVANVRCPILLISGRNDTNAPLAVMDAYVDKLRAAGKEIETYHPDNGPHGFYVGLPRPIPETAESTRRTIAFIKLHFERAATSVLRGVSAPSAAQTASSWPQRPLMEATFENSMEYRYLSKQVYESSVVDDTEADGSWSASGIGTIAYTTERAKDGKRSLRFRTSMRDEAYIKANRKEGSFIGGQGGYSSVRLKLAPPQDWSRFNRISLWVYVHPTAMRTYCFTLGFSCAGAPTGALEPVPTHFVHDLKAGQWNHVVWEIPDYRRDQVTGFTISQTLRGHDPEDEGIVTYDFDQIEVQRVDAEPYEGWEVAPGKIAFQHVGYRPSEEKVAFMSGVSDTQFALVDAESDQSVATFPVKTVKNRRGQFQILDFTSFTTPGRYLLRCGQVSSRPFAISDDLWYKTIEKAMNFYYGQRCGFDVPGVHRVCHQDWQGTHEGQTKIINGGWHDAGDLSQGSHRTGMAVYAMLQIYEQLRQRDIRPELQDRVLEEARWGLDWLLKTRFGKGYRITWALGRIYTDNQVGTIDDMVVPAQHVAYENFLFAAVAGYASRVLKDADPQRAAQSLTAAEEDYQATLDRRSDWSAATRDEAAFAALASVELYRATGKPAYTEQAVRFGRLLLECQEQRFVDGIPITGYFYTDTKRQRVMHDYHLSFEETPLMALRALCETYPDHADWMQWYGAALLHSEFFYRRGATASEPYRHIPNSVWRRSEIEATTGTAQPSRGRAPDPAAALKQFNAGTRLTEDCRLRVFPIWRDNLFHGNTAVQMSGTAALTAAAQLRHQPAIEELIRRQLQWVFGGNPFSESLMYGEGYDFQPLFAYCLRNLVGALPVGTDSRQNDAPCWPAVNIATYKEIWVVPVSRLLWSLAYMGMPARVTGSAASGAVYREARTGVTVEIPAGEFSLNLAPGDYTITYGNATKKMALLAGGRYELPLDAQRAIDLQLSARRLDAGMVQVEARVGGAGAHKVELRAFNGSVSGPQGAVDLTVGQEQTLTWKLSIASADKPWAVVVIPDGSTSDRKELFGTARDLPAIE